MFLASKMRLLSLLDYWVLNYPTDFDLQMEEVTRKVLADFPPQAAWTQPLAVEANPQNVRPRFYGLVLSSCIPYPYLVIIDFTFAFYFTGSCVKFVCLHEHVFVRCVSVTRRML